MKLTIKKGTTSKLLRVFITDSSKTDGSGLTGLVYNTASLTAYYIREGAASATAITLVTATVGTFTSSGFKEVDATNMPGVYELHPPNACLASGADSVLIFLKGATNMAPLPIEIQLDDNTAKDIYDRVGAPAGASVSVDIAENQTDLNAILEDTGTTIPNQISNLNDLSYNQVVGACALALTQDGTIDAIYIDTNELQINQGNWLTADVSALATVTDLKQHDNKITGLISMDDDLDLSPETWLRFNASNDLIGIRKFGPNKAQYDLEIKDAAVTDRVADDSKTIKYSGWLKSWTPGV